MTLFHYCLHTHCSRDTFHDVQLLASHHTQSVATVIQVWASNKHLRSGKESSKEEKDKLIAS